MKKLLLGLMVVSSLSAFAADLEVIGDSTTLRPSASAFDASKYDLKLDTSVTFSNEFKVKFMSPLILTGESVDLTGASSKVAGGLLHDENLDLSALQGAPSASALCALPSNAAKFTAANVVCAAGSDADSIKISADLKVAYSVKGSMQIDIAAMVAPHAVIPNPLVSVKLGSSDLTSSMAILNDAKDIKSAGGDIASIGYAGVDADKDIGLSFEVPFKGVNFKEQRGSAIHVVALAKSL